MVTSVVDRRAADQPVLQLDGVDVRFGGVHALQDVDLTVYQAEVLGPSGAGKTTPFDLISGVRAPDKGRIRCLGDEVTNRSSIHRARRGLRRTL
jgi:branched-chain amino acid transport system ATP-binding protein